MTVHVVQEALSRYRGEKAHYEVPAVVIAIEWVELRTYRRGYVNFDITVVTCQEPQSPGRLVILDTGYLGQVLARIEFHGFYLFLEVW